VVADDWYISIHKLLQVCEDFVLVGAGKNQHGRNMILGKKNIAFFLCFSLLNSLLVTTNITYIHALCTSVLLFLLLSSGGLNQHTKAYKRISAEMMFIMKPLQFQTLLRL